MSRQAYVLAFSLFALGAALTLRASIALGAARDAYEHLLPSSAAEYPSADSPTDAIKSVLNLNASDLASCAVAGNNQSIDRPLEYNAGTVFVVLDLDETGRATDNTRPYRTTSTTFVRVGNCIAAALRTLKFPAMAYPHPLKLAVVVNITGSFVHGPGRKHAVVYQGSYLGLSKVD